MSWIIKKSATADTYYTGRARSAWSSHMRDACVYESAVEAQDVVANEVGWPSVDIVVEELPPSRWH